MGTVTGEQPTGAGVTPGGAGTGGTGVAPTPGAGPGGGGETPGAPGVSQPGAGPGSPAVVTGDDDGTFVSEGDDPVIVAEPEPDIPPEDQLVEGEVCNSAEVSFEKVIPSVMLVLDRSTSMFRSSLPNGGYSGMSFGSFEDRWEGLRAAVAGLEPYSEDVQFGAATFTGFSPSNGGQCPVMEGLDIPVTFGNFDQILSLLPDSETAIPDSKSETPTAEGIEEALTILNAVETEGPQYLVLVTDGLPELCDPELLDKGVWCGHDPAFAVVQNAYLNGVTTYVIGIIGESSDQQENLAADYFLNGMAHAGLGLELQPPTDNLHCIQQESRIDRGEEPANDFYENWRPWAAATYAADGYTYEDTLYFAPADGDALGTQLAEVVEATRSCAFEMEDAVVRGQADKGAVQLELVDGSTLDLAYQGVDGWDLDPDNDYTVVVDGTSCTSIQSDQVANIKIQFPCEVRVPRVR